jgi:serine/threonine protein kinase
MIDMNGNLKIADFGLSKEGLRQNELTTTYCGSPEYMAPEMLSKYALIYLDLVIPMLWIIIV